MTAALTAWSYSRYEAYTLCPLKFKFKFLDKLPEEQAPAMARGNEIHKELATYIMGYGPDAPPAAVKSPFHQQLYREMRAIPVEDKLVEQQWGFTRAWAPTGWFGNATWFRNILDAAFLYEDLSAEVIDHKTGKRYGSNDEQMELFALSTFYHFKPATHVTTRLVYVDQGQENIEEFDRSVVPALTAKWEKKVAPMFADDQFMPRPNDKCQWCPWSRSKGGPCRFG